MTTAKNIKDAYKTAKAAKATSDAAIKDEGLTEDEFDAIIDAECEANDALIDALVDFSNGALDRDDACTLVLYSFDKLGALVARLAA